MRDDMIKTHCMVAGLLATSILGLPAQAAEQAGMIKVSKGTVSIEREGQRMAAGVGTRSWSPTGCGPVPMVRSAHLAR